MDTGLLIALAALGAFLFTRWAVSRVRLSRAKYPSLAGHGKIARFISKAIPYYDYDVEDALRCDGAPVDVVAQRRAALDRLSATLKHQHAETLKQAAKLHDDLSDLRFTAANRVPFQFRRLAAERLPSALIVSESDGTRVRDLDGNWLQDVSGSYGVNLLGYDTYKRFLDRGLERVRTLGPVLGPYHPIIVENVELIKRIAGADEVSFHMSGTEAVMQAVRLARYHTRRPRLIQFCGAYHGWWDGVQRGVGHRRSASDVFVLSEMSDKTLGVLATRSDIACVLVNPLQALHPNASASSDAMLMTSERRADFDRGAYAEWLKDLRRVCDQRGIVLIFDEVFVGFRLGLGGAQEYFGVRADLVTYGKTIGGGLPVGVVCGRAELMKRYRDSRPADVCFARGTFNSHPYVMATMNEFLRHVSTDETRELLNSAEATWDQRASRINDELRERELPVRVRNLTSIWTVLYTKPSRFNWLLQYYLLTEGLALSWVGTGRLIFSHNYSDADFRLVQERFVSAAARMRDDGWWSPKIEITNKSVKRLILREMLAAFVKSDSRPKVHPPSPSPGRDSRAA